MLMTWKVSHFRTGGILLPYEPSERFLFSRRNVEVRNYEHCIEVDSDRLLLQLNNNLWSEHAQLLMFGFIAPTFY